MAEAKSVETLLTAAAVSAAVATFVSLAVEWFAKPRLEARKDRILNLARSRREGTNYLLKVRELSVRLSRYSRIGPAVSVEDRSNYTATFKALHEELATALKRFDSIYVEVIQSPEDGIYSRVTGYLGVTAGIVRSGASWKDQGTAIAFFTLPLLGLWVTPKWRALKRRSHRRDFDAVTAMYYENPRNILDRVLQPGHLGKASIPP